MMTKTNPIVARSKQAFLKKAQTEEFVELFNKTEEGEIRPTAKRVLEPMSPYMLKEQSQSSQMSSNYASNDGQSEHKTTWQHYIDRKITLTK